MTLTQKIIKEFRERFPISIDYPPITQGGMEVFTQMEIDARQKRALVRNEVQESFLLSSLHKVATEAIEAVKLEKRETNNYKSSHNAVMHSHIDTGYNSAISDMEQKAKKFLENL